MVCSKLVFSVSPVISSVLFKKNTFFFFFFFCIYILPYPSSQLEVVIWHSSEQWDVRGSLLSHMGKIFHPDKGGHKEKAFSSFFSPPSIPSFLFEHFIWEHDVWCYGSHPETVTAAAAAESLQSCPTLCDPIDGSPPGSAVPGILQARTLEWVAISFSNAWKWKSESEVAQSCPTLSDPMACSLPGSSVHGIFQARVLEWGAIAFSRDCDRRLLSWGWQNRKEM